MNHLSEVDTAWLAGLFEGEGCLSQHGEPWNWQAVIAMADEDVIRRVYELVGIGSFRMRKRIDHRQDLYIWSVTSLRGVEQFMQAIRPMLGTRRGARADEFFAYLLSRPSGVDRAQYTHCRKGHPFDEDTPRRKGTGWRRCRPCRAAYAKTAAEKAKIRHEGAQR